MKQIGFKKMNWAPKQSAWNQHLQKAAKRREMMAQFERQNQALAGSLANAFSNQITANVDHVARTAVDRVIAEGKKRLEEQQSKLDAGLKSMNTGSAVDISA